MQKNSIFARHNLHKNEKRKPVAKTIINANNNSLWLSLKQLFKHRRLILLFTIRDVCVKYSQTYLGVMWSLIQPVFGVVIFTYIFGKLLNVGTDGSPYPIFVLTGLAPWYYFSYIVAYSGVSLIESQHIIRKIYFPKLVLPLSKSLTGLIDFSIWTFLIILLMIFYGVIPTYKILFYPIFVLLTAISGLTIGIWLSALTYRKRDFMHIIPYLIGFSIFITPVFFPTLIIPEKYHYLVYANPMAGIIQGIRWCLLGQTDFSLKYLTGIIPMLIFFIGSLFYFSKVEQKIADQV